MNFHFNHRQLLFLAIFTSLGLVALQVPLLELAGSRAQFTLFDSFAPIATGFIGTLPGLVAVFLMQSVNFLIHGGEVLDIGVLIRFVPVLFGAFYFGKARISNVIIPILAMIIFNLHPIGRSVWFYSLFWLIPVICCLWQEKFIFARALGATFAAHAVGGAIWIWAFELPKNVWIGLIPTVALERIVFAIGTSVIYLLVVNSIKHFEQRKEKKYAFYKN